MVGSYREQLGVIFLSTVCNFPITRVFVCIHVALTQAEFWFNHRIAYQFMDLKVRHSALWNCLRAIRRIITKSSRWRYAGNIFVCHNWLSVETWKWFCVYSENREALVTFGIQIYTQKSTTDWRTTNGNITKQTIVDFSVQIEMPEKSETFTAHMT